MQAPRHAQVAGYASRRRVPDGRLGETKEHEELRRLLREATRLLQSADLVGASEKLKRAGELASGRNPAYPEASGEHSGRRLTIGGE